MEIQKTVVGLTDLNSANKRLTDTLEKHTTTRNYLYAVLSGDEAYPAIDIVNTEVGDIISSIDMHKLPSNMVLVILGSMLEHEEKMVFQAWKEIYENAKYACEVIEQMKQTQEKEDRVESLGAEEYQEE